MKLMFVEFHNSNSINQFYSFFNKQVMLVSEENKSDYLNVVKNKKLQYLIKNIFFLRKMTLYFKKT